jgi:hypothetical protein
MHTECVLGYLVLSLLLWLAYKLYRRRWVGHGVLRIDRTDPDKDIYRLDLDNLDQITDKLVIELSVDPFADLSQD